MQGNSRKYSKAKSYKFTMKKNVFFFIIIVACYINNTEAATCSRYFGPSGARQCVKLLGYTNYQWATCRTDSYLKSTSGGRHHCSHPLYTYCWYQCMLEKYGRNGGDVYGSCRCNSASQNEKYTFAFAVLVAISCLLVS